MCPLLCCCFVISATAVYPNQYRSKHPSSSLPCKPIQLRNVSPMPQHLLVTMQLVRCPRLELPCARFHGLCCTLLVMLFLMQFRHLPRHAHPLPLAPLPPLPLAPPVPGEQAPVPATCTASPSPLPPPYCPHPLLHQQPSWTPPAPPPAPLYPPSTTTPSSPRPLLPPAPGGCPNVTFQGKAFDDESSALPFQTINFCTGRPTREICQSSQWRAHRAVWLGGVGPQPQCHNGGQHSCSRIRQS